MENASKALLIAGGMLLTMLVLSLLVYAWGIFSEYQAAQDQIKETEVTAKFNEQFINYQREDLLGYDVLSLVNKVLDYNQRYSSEGVNEINASAGNIASYKPIDVTINMGNNLNDLMRTVDVPTVPSDTKPRLTSESGFYTSITNENRLFIENHTYRINTTRNSEDLEKIIDKVKNIESSSDFGGETGLQNLVKSIDSIYHGAVINYNGIPKEVSDRNSWYEASYIIARYKTLTGVVPKGTTDNDKMDWIRDVDHDNERIKKVLTYYEYTQFKKATFECPKIGYDPNTGRVNSMTFEFKGIK